MVLPTVLLPVISHVHFDFFFRNLPSNYFFEVPVLERGSKISNSIIISFFRVEGIS
jgi:hypothetical protein